MSAARPAATRGDASHSLTAGALLTNSFAMTLLVLVAPSVNEAPGDDVRSAMRSARAARRSDSEDDPLEREVVSDEVLWPPIASAAFCIASATRFAVASAASDSRRTIDVAVTELGVASVARWRPMTSAVRECLTSILPSPPESLSFAVPVLAPFWSSLCEPPSCEACPSGLRSQLPARG